ncbi:MAG TPA: biotin/lipoyl-binding carrier protein [Nevskiaceae bacterium]|nr:biotin/lipoyl-binding carrier protein [Nevskiaceae bacterium]
MAHTINSEMTGTIAQVVTKVGAQVAAGDELCILESMKMEIPILADAAGLVAEIHVSEGEAINQGAPVVTLE